MSLNAVSAETTLGETIITQNLEVLGDIGVTNIFASGIITATSVKTDDLLVYNDAEIQGSLTVDVDLTVSGDSDLNNVSAGIVTATEFVGRGITPKGGIILWSGSLTEAVALEPNWAICDGRTVNGITTPNLVNRFIVGAGNGSSYTVGNTGGLASVSLTKENMPSHNHGGGSTNTYTTDTKGLHNHTVTIDDPGHNHEYTRVNGQGNDSGTENTNYARNIKDDANTSTETTGIEAELDNQGSHDHNVTVSFTIDSEGSGTAHENRPPYYALAYIMRTA